MKILHCCLSNYYADNSNYQENNLTRQNKEDGHEILIIASTETYINGKLAYTNTGEYINEDGIKVIRVPYKKNIPHKMAVKVRSYEGVYSLIENFEPEIIMFHGLVAYELKTVVKYKKKHPQVKLYTDVHADYGNSAKTFLSKQILHKGLYRRIVQKSLPWMDEVLCITLASMEFAHKIYNIPERKLEFYPLGGDILENKDYKERRERVRSELQVKEEDILFVHSGKMGALKRTEELLREFEKVKSERLKLVIAGTFLDDVKERVMPFLERDERIIFAGWKNPDQLMDLLCAADMYLQPGTQSVTMQNAMCNGCALMLYPLPSHEPYLHGNGFYVEKDDKLEKIVKIKNYSQKDFSPDTFSMEEIFRKIVEKPEELEKMREKSLEIAKNILDYRKLAARLYK